MKTKEVDLKSIKTTKDENVKFTIQDITRHHYHDDTYGFSSQEPRRKKHGETHQ